MKQEKQIAGLYMRLSQEDERQGESLSIDNQRHILRKYAEEHGFEIHAEYIDDGVSGTTFYRPQVQRLLDDAKTGVINTILVKDLSRFGRNYIEVGQYLDYVFPAFGIRFIAIQDNVDTNNRDSNAMEMMPIVNLFNEWHAANTSKKIRAVRQANAKEGKFCGGKPPYGYLIGSDEKRRLVIDEETAPIVVRIFETFASGISQAKIAETLNEEGVPSPGRVAFLRCGRKYNNNEFPLWDQAAVVKILNNQVYIGHLAQLRDTAVSYKNHMRIRKDPSEWIMTYNAHEPIVSQELWDKAHERMRSISRGRRTKSGYMYPLSGFLYCADCGGKMKMIVNPPYGTEKPRIAFDCGNRLRFGKLICFSHYISGRVLEQLVLEDIREKARCITLDEKAVREEFIKHSTETVENDMKTVRRELNVKQRRIDELSRLMQTAYEDRVKGIMPEDVCVGFIQKYSAEQKAVKAEIEKLEKRIADVETEMQNVDDFIRNIKKYLDVPELTREMCYELIDRVIIGGLPKITGKYRTIEIVYKADISSVLSHRFDN